MQELKESIIYRRMGYLYLKGAILKINNNDPDNNDPENLRNLLSIYDNMVILNISCDDDLQLNVFIIILHSWLHRSWIFLPICFNSVVPFF